MPSDGSAADASRYNEVFEFYVDSTGEEIDLVGLIAYALYKRQKRDWLIGYRSRNGHAPSDPELRGLTGGYLTGDAQRTYRDRAADLLNGYAEGYVEARTPSIREAALNTETLRQAGVIQQSILARSGFWSSVWSGIVSTALWTFFIAILAAAIGPDFFRAIADALATR